jgi:hypothetical protein
MMRQPDQPGALVADMGEGRRTARELAKKILQQVTRFRFVAGQIEQVREQGRRVLIIDASEVEGHAAQA